MEHPELLSSPHHCVWPETAQDRVGMTPAARSPLDHISDLNTNLGLRIVSQLHFHKQPALPCENPKLWILTYHHFPRKIQFIKRIIFLAVSGTVL